MPPADGWSDRWRDRWPDRWPRLLAWLGLVLVVWSLRPAVPAALDAAACDRIARVGAVVVCDAELDLVEVCGARHRLRSGDVLDDCSGPRRMDPDELAALSISIDVNADPARDLESLPGVGPVLAARIVAGRPYAHPGDLLAVHGLGPRTLARIKPRLLLSDPPP